MIINYKYGNCIQGFGECNQIIDPNQSQSHLCVDINGGYYAVHL